MTSDEIRSNIRYNENLIDQYIREKSGLEKQVEELEALRSKYSSLQSRFGERQSVRQNKLSLFLGSCVQNQIFKKYYEGMSGLLSGLEFNKAYEGLSEARNIINRKIWEIDDKIDECERQIAYRRSRRDYWHAQLAAALAEEAE